MLNARSSELLRRWALALAGFGLLIFFFSPPWAAFSLWSRVPEMEGMLEVRRGASVLEQVESPGAAISDPLHRAIQWRLLFPLLGHLLLLPPAVLFGLAHAGALLVLAYLVTVSRRASMDWLDTLFATVSLGAASWFFASTGWLGYYDSWLVLGLLFVAFGRSVWVLALACVWAPWVDERFVVAAPLALVCRWIWMDAARAGAAAPAALAGWRAIWNDRDRRREGLAVAALLAVFLVVRLVVLAGRSAEGATLASYFSGRDFLDAPLSRLALGAWEGLRAGWMFVGVALVLSVRRRAAFLGCVLVVTAAIGLATAQDYGRSIAMLMPAATLGALLAARRRPVWRRAGLPAAAALALLLPAHHVMNDRVNPIFYLYHELAALQNPPAAAMPELYELRAIHAMEDGDFAAAERDLDLAIRLSRRPVSASKQRGILRASQGRWAEAHRDFAAMVEHAPENPDAWYLRAQSNLALGQQEAAAADFDRARALATPGWTERPDVARFRAKLNQGAR